MSSRRGSLYTMPDEPVAAPSLREAFAAVVLFRATFFRAGFFPATFFRADFFFAEGLLAAFFFPPPFFRATFFRAGFFPLFFLDFFLAIVAVLPLPKRVDVCVRRSGAASVADRRASGSFRSEKASTPAPGCANVRPELTRYARAYGTPHWRMW